MKTAAGMLRTLDDQTARTALRTVSRFDRNTRNERKTIFPEYSRYPAVFYILNGACTDYQLKGNGTQWAVRAGKCSTNSSALRQYRERATQAVALEQAAATFINMKLTPLRHRGAFGQFNIRRHSRRRDGRLPRAICLQA